MLNDLKLDRAEFKSFIENTIDTDVITKNLETDLEDFAKRVHDRRHKIFEAKKKIDKKIDVEKNQKFIDKASKGEERYPDERRTFIKRNINEQFKTIVHEIWRGLLNDG